MLSVIHFRKQLIETPVVAGVPGIVVRSPSIPGDVPAWLALRDHAMRGEVPLARPWSGDDFHVEITAKPWWREDRTWLAFCEESPSELVGSVTLAMRQGAAGSVPVVHWLLVDPAWRRRGVGRLLMSKLERAAWDAGWREVRLETHSGWAAAVAFYQSIGYASLGDRPPR
jgi:GNAT superfamily N-acetyltransferase